jgi:Sec-independent protein translocase protein TatA
METNASNRQLIVRYLLGDLPEAEQARLEDRAFSDREYLQTIEEAENDLIDDYVRGALSDAERRRFERGFAASAERKKKIEFARALARVVPASEAATTLAAVPWWKALFALPRGLNPALQFSMAAAAVLLVFGAAWLFVANRSLRTQIARLQAERQQQEETLRQQAAAERARGEELARQLERERARGDEPAQGNASFIASLFLPPGIGRGEDKRPKLALSPATRAVRLRVGLEQGDDFNRYRVEISAAQGQPVWTRDRLRAQTSPAGRVIDLRLPAGALPAGRYELALQGVNDSQPPEDLRYYYFDVQRRNP